MNYKQKSAKVLFILVFLLILIVPTSVLAVAPNLDKSGNLYLMENVIIEAPYWAAGQSILLNSQMKDDVYLAGANIVVSGPIDGDLIVAGSNVIINSEIKGDLRVAAGMITINGQINGNVTALGGLITLGQGAQINKSLVVLGGNVEINGKIEKNVYAAVGNLVINNEIKGDVKAVIDSDGGLTLFPQAAIGGNLNYSASKNAQVYEGAQINEENFTLLKAKEVTPVKKAKGLNLTFWFIGLLSSLVIGLVAVYILKDLTVKIKNQILINSPLTILKGALYLIVTPLALLFLAVTIIGAPLAFILGSLFGIALCLCKIFIGVCLGDWLLKNLFKQNQVQLVWAMMLGVFCLYLIFLIPFIGLLAKLVIVIWGLGAIMIVLKKELKLENS